MGQLEKEIVRKLVSQKTPKQKKEVQDKILLLIGGDPKISVRDLPPRRGNQDGRIDGRVNVIWLDSDCVAAINIKIEKRKFDADRLGGFILAMDREKLDIGIIITASGLAPDAEAELKRKNREGDIYLVHIHLEDLLSGSFETGKVTFRDGNITQIMANNLKKHIEEIR
ncbi:restriction endonuclease [Geitlerinema sp. CS-897]|uniref:restriction endonuclease n=1 Tax=Baaleninema simplex TaxID=2862350 RepID=UPI00038040C0|nr:restriction endonuclease [Baaleninema simplex]MDC0832382.1 restriction endonuclease [Geitlerinema sp. CS-897]